jgi:hypothetical protein
LRKLAVCFLLFLPLASWAQSTSCPSALDYDHAASLEIKETGIKGTELKGTEMALKEIHAPTRTKYCLLHIESTNGKPLERFRNGCRPNPDFLWSFVGPPNCMRLSAKKAAHHFSQLVPRCRKSGQRTAFSWSRLAGTTPRDLYRATVIAKRSNLQSPVNILKPMQHHHTSLNVAVNYFRTSAKSCNEISHAL